MAEDGGLEIMVCPFLKGDVELTEEREQHIAKQHPDLLPEHKQYIIETLANPDQIRKSSRFGNARMFSRWFADLRGGKHVVAVVLSEISGSKRNWIVTAYVARRLAEGEVEWKRN
jgi:hypothetical protein